MDGASKFVRGDAVAATVITVINLLGGFAIGVISHHLSVSQAAHTYSILSVGDGLISQIPALLLSLSTGIIVTRGAVEDDVTDFGSDVIRQIREQPRSIQVAGIALMILGFIPGLPHIPFLLIGTCLVLIAGRIRSSITADAVAVTEQEAADAPVEDLDSPQAIMRSVRNERLELKIAPNLAPLLMVERGGDLEGRLKALRRDIASKKGFVIPTVRTTDDTNLPPNSYRIMVNNNEVARGNAYVGQELAIGPGLDRVQGIATTEPAFGLPAKWIPVESRERAIAQLGITPFPATSVIITHLAEVVASNAADLLSTQQVQQMLDALKASDPALVEEMKLSQLSLMELQRVLAALLSDNIPILDFVRITEAVTARCRMPGKTQEALVEAARSAVGAAITTAHLRDDTLAVVTVDALAEQALAGNLKTTDSGTALAIDAGMTERIVNDMRDICDKATADGKEAVLLVSPPLRPALARLFAAAMPRLAVLSVAEISRGVRLERVGVIGGVSATVDV
jgi:flagellar biosynthesis protein FlhA